MPLPFFLGGMILTQQQSKCVTVSKKVVESAIWSKPPLYLKVWFYLLVKSKQSQEWGFPSGQLCISIAEIRDACGWKIGYRATRPTKRDVIRVLQWLKSQYQAEKKGKQNASHLIRIMEENEWIMISDQ